MENEKFSNNPRFTNRGVVNTLGTKLRGFSINNSQYILIDWLQGTIKNYSLNVFNVYDIFSDIFHVKREDVITSAGGLYGYNYTYSYKNIKIMSCDYRDDMGYHIYIPGSGCRDIEDLQLDYQVLIQKLICLGCHFTRIDISIDNYSHNYFSLDDIKSCIAEGEVLSKFRNSIEFIKTDLASGANQGYTIWFGSRSSDIQIVFYDKMKERESQGYIVEKGITSWIRLECRFRNERAGEMAVHFSCSPLSEFKKYYKGIIFNYLKFVVYSPTDSCKSRWPVKSWWLSFLDNVEKIQFQSINVESSITKSRRWLVDSVSHTNLKVLLADLNYSSDDQSVKLISDMLKSGFKFISDQDLQEINSYRLKSKLNPISRSDIENFCRDVSIHLSIKEKDSTSYNIYYVNFCFLIIKMISYQS